MLSLTQQIHPNISDEVTLMLNHTYKYQNYLRNQTPTLGPLYTSFVVVVEMQMEDVHVLESVCCLDEMAEIG
jgi:hypothetical protein